MARYRKKPVTVEAIQFTFDHRGGNHDEIGPLISGWIDSDTPYINTLEGRMTVSNGDWIIRGVKGELYPCKPDVFSASYEKVSD